MPKRGGIVMVSKIGEKAMDSRTIRARSAEELIAMITQACGNEKHVFRGEPREYERVSSGIYRQFGNIFADNGDFLPVDAEVENVKKARQAQFTNTTSVEEILTDLRHFGGSTTLIDFSYSLPVALFFACSRDPEKDGRIILAKINRIVKNFDAKAHGLEKDLTFLRPVRTINSRVRVESQSSIFIHAPRGYIDMNNDGFICLPIPKKLKRACLKYLDSYYNIRTVTIYNDLIGYIENEKNFELAQKFFLSGLAKSYNGELREAIDEYSRSIELAPDMVNVWYNRANDKHRLKWHEEAIIDYDQAIELQSDYVIAWNNRGNVKMDLGRYEDAIQDFAVSIEINPTNFLYWSNRGAAKRKLGRHADALSDYDQAINLEPGYAYSWQQRGIIKIDLEMYKEAIFDFDQAIRIYPRLSLAWYGRAMANRFLGNIPDSKNDLKQASDLARMEGNTELESEINSLFDLY